jgi:superfamily I DNA/RNA helicase
MTWAGAEPENFKWLAQDHSAKVIALTTNFRSNLRIVEIVNRLAQVLEPEAAQVRSAHLEDDLPELTDGIIHFSSTEEEAEGIASFIKRAVDAGESQPSDFLLLLRQLANAAEDTLRGRFEANGLALRNEARLIGALAIQDIVTEPFSDLIISLLQMAVEDRENAPFERARNSIAYMHGLDDDRDDSQLRLDTMIRKLVTDAQSLTREQEVDQDRIVDFVSSVIRNLGKEAAQRLSPEYEQEERFEEIVHSLALYLSELHTAETGWLNTIRKFIGIDQVRLMTIHKSKGLEAKSVFFLHLQNDGFYKNADMEDEKFALFVAASRARDQFFVTTTSQARNRVQPLWNFLAAAEMPTLS